MEEKKVIKIDNYIMKLLNMINKLILYFSLEDCNGHVW